MVFDKKSYSTNNNCPEESIVADVKIVHYQTVPDRIYLLPRHCELMQKKFVRFCVDFRAFIRLLNFHKKFILAYQEYHAFKFLRADYSVHIVYDERSIVSTEIPVLITFRCVSLQIFLQASDYCACIRFLRVHVATFVCFLVLDAFLRL